MKTELKLFFILLLTLLPLFGKAQVNIQTAFNAVIKCPEAYVTKNSSLDKEPATNVKLGQSEVYNFTLPLNKIQLVKNIEDAFEKDREKSFYFYRGKTKAGDSNVYLAVGDGRNDVQLTDANSNFVYALFLAPVSEDPKGIYRYAWGLSYKEKGGKIIGRFVITYATTLKYRQEGVEARQLNLLKQISNQMGSSSPESSQHEWFESLMTCFQSMSSANSQTRIALATKAYKLIQNVSDFPGVTEFDKETIKEILKGMISDPKYSETILNKLLSQCLAALP